MIYKHLEIIIAFINDNKYLLDLENLEICMLFQNSNQRYKKTHNLILKL